MAMDIVSYEAELEQEEEEETKKTSTEKEKEKEKHKTFQSKGKNELEKLKKIPIFTKGYIRVKFPNSLILQAAFSPKETMEFVYKFLRDVILFLLKLIIRC